ncbi:MAG: paraquat-inducible protein A [Thermoanaerobaculia bacterium]
MTITCADCGATQVIPTVPSGATAECYRCDRLLVRRTKTGFNLTLSCAIAICILLPPAVLMPVMDSTIRKLGFVESRLVSSVPVIYSEVWFPFALGFLFFAFLFPALRALVQVIVLGSLRWGWRIWQPGRLFRWSEEIRIWCMTDVVVIGGVIAYFRAAAPAGVEARDGAWCYLAVAILAFVGDRSMDRRAVWNAILPDSDSHPGRHIASCDVCEMAVTSRRPGDLCPRCGRRLERDIEPRFAPALAAVAAAIPLCLPAFTAAIIVNDNVTGVWQHTFLGTVRLLADRGYWQYGVVVLLAGVAIPAFELIGLSWMLARVRFPSSRGLVTRTRLYRVLHRLVRWPMIIPVLAAIIAPVLDVRPIHDLVAGPGATPLVAVIALLMLAMRLFEPRLMWERAGEAT